MHIEKLTRTNNKGNPVKFWKARVSWECEAGYIHLETRWHSKKKDAVAAGEDLVIFARNRLAPKKKKA